jgi:MFS family permease
MNAEAALIERQAGRSVMVGFHAMFSVGGALGAGLGALAALALAPFAHFVVAAALGLAALATRRGTLPGDALPGDAGPAFSWPRGPLVPIAAVAFLGMMAEGAAADWSAVYLRETLAAGPALAAVGYAVFAVGMTIGRLSGDALGDRLGETRLVRASALLAAVALGAGLATQSAAGALVGFALAGLGLAAIVPICFRRAAAVPGVSAGHGLAAVATVGYSGFLIGPPAIGLVAEVSGLALGLGLVAATLLAIPLLVRPPSPARTVQPRTEP